MRLLYTTPLLPLLLSSPLFAVFTPGSIGGQEGWSGGAGGTVSPLVDQTLVQNDGNFANGAFRISNKTTSDGSHINGAFGGWVHSPTLGVNVGQPGSGAGADSMSVSFYFKTVSPVADGSNMDFCFTNVANTSRNIFFSIENDTDPKNGLKFRTQEPNGTSGSFFGAVDAGTASNLARNTWFKVEIIMTTLAGGPGNDTFDVKLDNSTVLSGIRTFEDAMIGQGQPYIISDGLMIRSGRTGSGVDGTSFTNLHPQGYLIDDLMIKSFNASAPGVTLSSYSTDFTVVPEPATWAALAGVGALALAVRRRRRS